MTRIEREPGQISFVTTPNFNFEFIFSPFFVFSVIVYLSSLFSFETTEITCRKLEPRLANCQLTTTPKLPIFPSRTQELNGIKGAEYITKTETNSEGDEYTVHFVVFQKLGGQKEVRMRMNAELAPRVAVSVNNFLESPEQTLTLTGEENFNFSVLVIILFPGLFLAICAAEKYTELYRFVSSANMFREQVSINRNLGKVTHLRTVIGTPYFERTCRFGEIQAVQIHTIKGTYKLKILLSQGTPIDVYSTTDHNEALELMREIANLIGCQNIEVIEVDEL